MKALEHVNKEIRILVVDDFASMRQIVRKALGELGFHNVSEAAGGKDALRKIESGESFELIISDWNMPQMSGLDLLQHIRASDKSKKLPFLMITAEAQRDNIIEAAKAGVSQYIVKPFTAESLEQKLGVIFAQR
jgi:two-component system chemotaxis response regulator CheY